MLPLFSSFTTCIYIFGSPAQTREILFAFLFSIPMLGTHVYLVTSAIREHGWILYFFFFFWVPFFDLGQVFLVMLHHLNSYGNCSRQAKYLPSFPTSRIKAYGG